MADHNDSVFQGGIHPTDGSDKQLTKDEAIQVYIPERVEISMEQSFGGVCEPIVQVGDEVAKGQLIGKPMTFKAANVHASITGIVKEITEKKKADGTTSIICVIEGKSSLAQEDKIVDSGKWKDIEQISREEILNGMSDSGLIGMGGAGFPTRVKYETKEKIKYVLINGAECEPFLTCDHRIMLECGMQILNGIRLLVKASGAEKGILCIEDNKEECIKKLSEQLEQGRIHSQKVSVEIRSLPTKYPQGGERQLIDTVLGVQVPMGGLPASVGVIVSNVATAKAIADFMLEGQPLIQRCVTVTGAVAKPGNFLVPIGTPYRKLIKLAGSVINVKNKLILGGPMTGTCIGINITGNEIEGSVTKTSSGLVVLPGQFPEETNCIRCGACGRICPAGINPFKIDFAYLHKNIDLCEKLYATECIGCGSCSFVCPAERRLAERCTKARDAVRAQKRNVR